MDEAQGASHASSRHTEHSYNICTTRNAAELHTPVLLDECLDMLAPAIEGPGSVLIDATLGMGGHTEGALRRFPGLVVIGIDRDPEAVALASKRLEGFGPRFLAVRATYDSIGQVVADHAPRGEADGVLMDLGVSSLQLDDAERGFSYSQDAPLDMRMDPTRGVSAAELLATAPQEEITRILRAYGEERFAPRIARLVVARRGAQPLTRTGQLVDIVREAIPAPARRTGGNPAKRTFQALRVAVNDELAILERALPAALASLRVGGRLVVESYQSLEDRIVKRALAAGTAEAVPADLPVVPADASPYLRAVTRGAEKADPAEIASNPRSASVRLRAVTRTRPASEAPSPQPRPHPIPTRKRPTHNRDRGRRSR